MGPLIEVATARCPRGLRYGVLRIGKMECGQFVGKIKPVTWPKRWSGSLLVLRKNSWITVEVTLYGRIFVVKSIESVERLVHFPA